MAVRFAGDYFGVSLTEPQAGSSSLLQYFPELRSAPVPKNAKSGKQVGESSGIYSATRSAPVFGGFKEFEKSQDQNTGAPAFGGFKVFERPK